MPLNTNQPKPSLVVQMLSTLNERILLTVPEYQSWCINLHCHRNRIRRTLLTDSYFHGRHISSKYYSKMHLLQYYAFLSSFQKHRNEEDIIPAGGC